MPNNINVHSRIKLMGSDVVRFLPNANRKSPVANSVKISTHACHKCFRANTDPRGMSFLHACLTANPNEIRKLDHQQLANNLLDEIIISTFAIPLFSSSSVFCVCFAHSRQIEVERQIGETMRGCRVRQKMLCCRMIYCRWTRHWSSGLFTVFLL